LLRSSIIAAYNQPAAGTADTIGTCLQVGDHAIRPGPLSPSCVPGSCKRRQSSPLTILPDGN